MLANIGTSLVSSCFMVVVDAPIYHARVHPIYRG
jgi:hypothetical protein